MCSSDLIPEHPARESRHDCEYREADRIEVFRSSEAPPDNAVEEHTDEVNRAEQVGKRVVEGVEHPHILGHDRPCTHLGILRRAEATRERQRLFFTSVASISRYVRQGVLLGFEQHLHLIGPPLTGHRESAPSSFEIRFFEIGEFKRIEPNIQAPCHIPP